ncbi:MAG: nuclear transport factor 2 family protein, partial [Myxococcales bacterium]|nr:nuclear transport factor 2 family protein [Myxococcales bacterium]
QYIESPIYDAELRVRRSDDTEAITDLMETYARAVDGMDLATIRELVSDSYFENAGTTDTTRDDYGVDGLETVLTTLRDHVDDIDVGVAVRDIRVAGDAADVLFEYTLRVRYTVADASHWQTERDVNRFQLAREHGEWRIVSGL